jgi:hypothetical protein
MWLSFLLVGAMLFFILTAAFGAIDLSAWV